MEMYYVTKGINNYIQVNAGQNIIQKNSPQAFRLKMLESNEIEGLIHPISMEMDGCLTLKYNTGSSYVLDRLFLRLKPDGGFLRILMEQIERLLVRLKEYLLEPDDLVIRPEYMFYDWGGKVLRLIYIPGYGRSLRLQLKEFLEYIMKIFDHRDDEGVRYMYGMYDLVSEDTFSLEDFSYKLEASNASEEQSNSQEQLPLAYETSTASGSLVPQENHITKLVPLTSGALKEIILSKYDEMILVGRGKKETDYRIQTTQISRVHACIYLRSNGVYIEDRESTNGTFINSVRLEPLKQQLIQVGDLVNFANEEFFAV